MSADILAKVLRLIALAGSSNENEARNAAHKACALIREHKLVISVSNPAGSQWPNRTPPSTASDPWSATGRKPETRFYKICQGCLNVRVEWTETYCTLCKMESKPRTQRAMDDLNQVFEDMVRGKAGVRAKKTPPKKVKVDYDKVWFVECATCMYKAPNGRSSEEADIKALEAGFRLIEDKPMCPGCIYKYDERMGTKTP